MIRRVATAAVLIPLVVGSLLHSPILFMVLAGLFLLVACMEMLRLVETWGADPIRITPALALALPWIWNEHFSHLPLFLIASTLLLLARGVLGGSTPRRGLVSAAASLATLAYLGFPVALAVELSRSGAPELLWILIVVWVSDSAAYLVGRNRGRRQAVPRISPGKTVEGYAAGLASGIAAGLAAGALLPAGRSLLFLGSAGLLVSVAGAAGDLFESWLKRAAGLKDSSTLLPGHGGVLDRIDSFLLALPAYYLLTLLVK